MKSFRRKLTFVLVVKKKKKTCKSIENWQMLCCFEVDCVLDMMLTLCMIECMFYIVGTMLVAPIAARLRPGAGGRYNAGRRVTVDNGLHRHELDLHNMRRKVKRIPDKSL